MGVLPNAVVSRARAQLRIAACSAEEAKWLLPHHYASGAPARVCRMLGAWLGLPEGEELAGILTVSHPTLNGRWRAIAWPGEYSGKSKRSNAQKLNAEVRRISRVIVLPRHRGQGIATALVRAYLRHPVTKRTETVAAMGRYCGCFERAGMRSVRCDRSARDVRLGAALRAMRIHRESLVDDGEVAKLAGASGPPDFVRELRRWANAARATRAFIGREDELELIAPAGGAGARG